MITKFKQQKGNVKMRHNQQMGLDIFGVNIDTAKLEEQARAAALAELAKQTSSDPIVNAQIHNQLSQTVATKIVSKFKENPMLYGGIALGVGLFAIYGVINWTKRG